MRTTGVAIMVAITLMFTAHLGDSSRRKGSRRSKRHHVSCRLNTMVRYQLTVHTLWSKEVFPRMYPLYRPPAQWSALVGRSHGPEFRMWQEGANATLGVKQFAETGDSSFLHLESVQGFADVLDTFTAPAIAQSFGQTSAVIFLDGSHTQMSFMMRIIPSPDWFIGVSALDLCHRGRWRMRVHTNLQPMDAGTDRGLTFTAPNWPNVPASPISAITSSIPNHPASSFFYPEHAVLPRIAYMEMNLISEYRLRKTIQPIESQSNKTAMSAVGSGLRSSDSTKEITKGEHFTSLATHTQKMGVVLRNESDSTAKLSQSHVVQVSGSSVSEKNHGEDQDVSAEENHVILGPMAPETQISKAQQILGGNDRSYGNLDSASTDVSSGKRAMKTDNEDVGGQDAEIMEAATRAKGSPTLRELIRNPAGSRQSKYGEGIHAEPNTEISKQSYEEPQFHEVSTVLGSENGMSSTDCEVTDWSAWTGCSQTCGFGTQQRRREVLNFPQNGGANCPKLRQEALCGSMRNCKWQHFSLLRGNTKSSRRRSRQKMLRRRRPSNARS